jgi:hypothetical protein
MAECLRGKTLNEVDEKRELRHAARDDVKRL